MAIPKIETLATTASLRQGLLFINTFDPTLQALFSQTNFEHRLETIAKSARLKWPNLTLQDLTAYKIRQAKQELKQWSQLPSKGKAVPDFANDKYGNCWFLTRSY
jgi:hypothetical protein